MKLTDFDWIIVNTRPGKDRQARPHYICTMARKLDILKRVILVHADLGRVEWPGVRELAHEHAKHYGVDFKVISRPQGNLLEQIRNRGMWPDSKNRYCTSDHKRGEIEKILRARPTKGWGMLRVLNCLGFRKEESTARAKRPSFELEKRLTRSEERRVWK